MNNKIEVIGIDHGWSNIKTSSQVFVTGVKEITTEPALFDGVLEYKGRYYKVGGNTNYFDFVIHRLLPPFQSKSEFHYCLYFPRIFFIQGKQYPLPLL